MNRLQLAILLSWADESGLEGRKRLQKVVYLLQQAGCPLGCQYVLHHYGPYSRDVADICDEMVAADLIEEDCETSTGATRYVYRLAEHTRSMLGTGPLQERLAPFKELAEELIAEKVWPLELGATIALFYDRENDWDAALQEACAFKSVPSDHSDSMEALDLAKRVVSRAPAR